jgi:phosphatidylethanolamine/phosphatidyl-N-methylethanolamine N-methyltransferase
MSFLIVSKNPPTAPAGRKIREYGRFVREFIRHPVMTGAIAPSSTALAHAMLKPVNFFQVRVIAELGSGTGSFTRHILDRRLRHTRFIALETNPAFITSLTGRWEPSSFVQRSARELRQVLHEGGLHKAGAIVSGLPWAGFQAGLQKDILEQVSASLEPGGVFVTFAYLHGLVLPGGIRFRRLLNPHFTSVERSKMVWTNLPPAFVYVCRNQAAAAQEAA